jgi:ethanolamine utilization protein EutQ
MTEQPRPAGVRHLTSSDPEVWYQPGDQRIFLADVLDPSNSDSMSVGFARYAKGEANAWTMAYDEALIITKGRFTVRHAGGEQSADAGEVLFLQNGTELVYQADEDTELVYVTHPHWMAATEKSAHAAQLEAFHPA